MDSVVKFSFFIVLSLALHVVSLPYDFMVPAASLKPHSVKIDYVSRSLDSFYTPPDNTVSAPFEQPQDSRKKTKTIVEINSIAPIVKPKLKDQLPKTIAVAVGPVPVKKVDDLDPAVLDAPLLAEEIPAPEIIPQPLLPPAAKITSQKGGEVVQSMVSPDRIPLVVGQNGGSQQGFKDALPRYKINPPPRYPQVAKLRGWEGRVVFRAMILSNGDVGHLQVLTSSGYRSLDNAARKAIRRWRFNPATSFGLSIDSQVEIPITFSLENM